jgi:hypothetical protein
MASRKELSCPRGQYTKPGLPSSWWFFLRALSHSTPPARLVLRIESFPTNPGFTSSGRLAAPSLRNQAKPSSLSATARAFAFPSFNGQDRSCPLKGRLHDSRPFIMVNTSQLTRTTKLCLALSRPRRGTSRTPYSAPLAPLWFLSTSPSVQTEPVDRPPAVLLALQTARFTQANKGNQGLVKFCAALGTPRTPEACCLPQPSWCQAHPASSIVDLVGLKACAYSQAGPLANEDGPWVKQDREHRLRQ